MLLPTQPGVRHGDDGTGADGRRLFTAEFKRQQIDRVTEGEATISELSRELGISRSLLQRWKQLLTQGGEAAVAANGAVVPASDLRAAEQRLRELERALGRKTLEVEVRHAAREEVKTKPRWYGASAR